MTVGVHTGGSGGPTPCEMLTTSANLTPWKNVANAGQPECEKPFWTPCAKWKRHRGSASPPLGVGKLPGATVRPWAPESGICSTSAREIPSEPGKRKTFYGG